MPFMRALLTTKTLLYMGFSFSDEYLEELRSQCLALLVGSRGSSSESQLRAGVLPAPLAGFLPAPLGYAVMEFQRKADCEPVEPENKLLEYHRRHEGLGYLLYETENNSHDKADELLKDIVQSTSLRWRLHERLAGSEDTADPQKKRKAKHLLWFDRPSPDSMSQHAQVLSELSFMQLEETEPMVVEKIEALNAQRKDYEARFKEAKEKIEALKAQRKDYEARFKEAKEAAKKVMEAAKSAEDARVKALTKEKLLAELKLRENPWTDYKTPEACHAEVTRRGRYEDPSATREVLENARREAPPPTSEALAKAGLTGSEFGGAEFERLMAKTGGEKLTHFEVPYRAPEIWPLPDGGSIDCVFARKDFLKLLQDNAELPASPPRQQEGYVVESANDSFEAIVDVEIELDKKFSRERAAYYTALFTLNGFLGPDRPSFLQTTMQVISTLPMRQRMPVIGV